MTKPNWKEEFDLDFSDIWIENGFLGEPDIEVGPAIKDFISSLLSTIESEIEGKRWIEEVIDGKTYIHRRDNPASSSTEHHADIENWGIDTALQVIRSYRV